MGIVLQLSLCNVKFNVAIKYNARAISCVKSTLFMTKKGSSELSEVIQHIHVITTPEQCRKDSAGMPI